MFEPSFGPRVFGLPCGAQFPAALVAGLVERMRAYPPEAMGRVELLLNSTRMLRLTKAAFAHHGALFMPRMRLLSELHLSANLPCPPPVPTLRRKLELAELVEKFTKSLPDFEAGTNVYMLAQSLSDLLDEMQSEGVEVEHLAALPISDSHAVHWQRSLQFIEIVAQYFGRDPQGGAPARQRAAVEHLTELWQSNPPQHPIIVAGSTGSRGATAMLMTAVAHLPQGALVLPGFDFSTPAAIWEMMIGAKTPMEDHPQYRFAALAARLGLDPAHIGAWHAQAEPARNRVMSLALRPAPVTDQWRAEGKQLPDLEHSLADVTLIEAPDQRREAVAIALVLRAAAERNERAALISPDRVLTRRVSANLLRWGIVPDDSAGAPLPLSPPGRFLRHVAQALSEPLSIARLMTLLKHPLTATGAGRRGDHMRYTRELELQLRARGPAYPKPQTLLDWAEKGRSEGDARLARRAWAVWLAELIEGVGAHGPRAMAAWHAMHMRIAEQFAAGPAGDVADSELWRKDGGEIARRMFDELAVEARGHCSAAQYCDLVMEILQGESLPAGREAHPKIAILGALEARAAEAELLVLAGLNEGEWPAAPAPDPWLSRQMRLGAGLLLPERQIGLSAHDFQQGFGAQSVVLTRADRSASAQTVRSRWLSRFYNLLRGLPEKNGPQALAAMQARGKVWLDYVAALETVAQVAPAPRPSPCPPLDSRPRELAVTDISRLIRDPYEIYARKILKLRALNPLQPDPDARLRGQVLHLVVERFTRAASAGGELSEAHLMQIAEDVLAAEVPWPSAQRLWLARLRGFAGAFVASEQARRALGAPVVLEEFGRVSLGAHGFTLLAKPDRIDLLNDDCAHIYDYKTGKPPTAKQMDQFEVQLLLEAAMVERGGFAALGPRAVPAVSYIQLGVDAPVSEHRLDAARIGQVWAKLQALMDQYFSLDQGYTARRAPCFIKYASDYDQLSRYGEWQDVDEPQLERVGDA